MSPSGLNNVKLDYVCVEHVMPNKLPFFQQSLGFKPLNQSYKVADTPVHVL